MIAWILILAVLVAAIFYAGPASLQSANGINQLQTVELGGVAQWVSIRSLDAGKPVLLFLHGGPGSANLAKLRVQTPALEEHFVVVNWDQRGAGKSAGFGFDYASLSIDQIVSDAHELVGYLKARFGVEKIYLLGFSWGTIVGLELAARYPDDLYAYISVSQEVSLVEAEKLSLEYVQVRAHEAKNERAIAELAGIDPTYRNADWPRQLSTERKWLLQFGGVYHTANSYLHEAWMMLRAPEYSLYDFARWPFASTHALQALWPEVMRVDFFETYTQLHVPVYFFVGRHDYNAPGQIVARYVDQLVAPAGKHLIWFENSAHDPFFDEPEQLVREIVEIIK
ncbi:MAG: alpha/beta fold hydrolase [Chloroflexota bacterium]